MILEMAKDLMGSCEVFVIVLMMANVTQWTGSLILWFRGAYPTQATGTTTGLVSMADLNGMDSSVLQSQIQNPWENRYFNAFLFSFDLLFSKLCLVWYTDFILLTVAAVSKWLLI